MRQGGLFSTNPDLADILDRMDLDFENNVFFDFLALERAWGASLSLLYISLSVVAAAERTAARNQQGARSACDTPVQLSRLRARAVYPC